MAMGQRKRERQETFCVPASELPRTPGSIRLGLGGPRLIDQIVQGLQARGVRFEDFGGGAIIDDGAVKPAYFRDPDGNLLYLCEVAPR